MVKNIQPMISEIWEDWNIVEKIGDGSYGTVFKACHKTKKDSYRAIKVIQIPRNEQEKKQMEVELQDFAKVRQYYEDLCFEMLKEIQYMMKLKGNNHVVRLYDYHLDANDEECKWTIYIQMEYLQDFMEYSALREMSEKEVIQLGLDLCDALRACEENGIVHRDIKPSNILRSSSGDFKLADFGIASTFANIQESLSVKGNLYGMAPEVFHCEDYDHRADQYSVGLLLYQLMNRKRMPFVDVEKDIIYRGEKEKAFFRRMKGEVFSPPCNASKYFGNTLLKACAYDQNDRFETFQDFENALKYNLDGKEMQKEKDGKAFEWKEYLLILAIFVLVLTMMFIVGTSPAMENQRLKSKSEGAENINGLSHKEIMKMKEQSHVYNGQNMENYYLIRKSPLIKLKEVEYSELNDLLYKDYILHDKRDDIDSKYEIIYGIGSCAVVEGVRYRSEMKDIEKAPKVYATKELLYFRRQENGQWRCIKDQGIPRYILDKIQSEYYPKGLTEAIEQGRNNKIYKDIYWTSHSAYYDDVFEISIGAIWQNEDLSIDILLLCRNGNDEKRTDYDLFLAAHEEGKAIFSLCEDYVLSVNKKECEGKIIHIPASDVLQKDLKWDAAFFGVELYHHSDDAKLFVH